MSQFSPAARIQANLKDLFQAKLSPGDAYIRFRLATEVTSFPAKSTQNRGQVTSEITALLSMEQVQESVIVEAEKITPLPSMPESVIGIMTANNHVFCVFDLAQLLKLHFRSISPQKYQIIVLQTTSKKPIYLGLAVTYLQGIVRLSTEKIHSSWNSLPPNIIPYLSGAIELEEKLTPILDFKRISEVLIKLSNN